MTLSMGGKKDERAKDAKYANLLKNEAMICSIRVYGKFCRGKC